MLARKTHELRILFLSNIFEGGIDRNPVLEKACSSSLLFYPARWLCSGVRPSSSRSRSCLQLAPPPSPLSAKASWKGHSEMKIMSVKCLLVLIGNRWVTTGLAISLFWDFWPVLHLIQFLLHSTLSRRVIIFCSAAHVFTYLSFQSHIIPY